MNSGEAVEEVQDTSRTPNSYLGSSNLREVLRTELDIYCHPPAERHVELCERKNWELFMVII